MKRELSRMHDEIAGAFSKVKEELDDHRESINQNGFELHHMEEFLSEIDQKLEKLRSRIDNIELALEQQDILQAQVQPEFSERERQLLLMLYANEEKHLKLSQIARRLSTTVAMLKLHVQHIQGKGIPLMQEVRDDSIYLWLDSSFRDKQAKLNVLRLNKKMAQSLD
ncbi:MAG: hypothetical protein V1735_02370 [Nanoarchaeota archaeon]